LTIKKTNVIIKIRKNVRIKKGQREMLYLQLVGALLTVYVLKWILFIVITKTIAKNIEKKINEKVNEVKEKIGG